MEESKITKKFKLISEVEIDLSFLTNKIEEGNTDIVEGFMLFSGTRKFEDAQLRYISSVANDLNDILKQHAFVNTATIKHTVEPVLEDGKIFETDSEKNNEIISDEAVEGEVIQAHDVSEEKSDEGEIVIDEVPNIDINFFKVLKQDLQSASYLDMETHLERKLSIYIQDEQFKNVEGREDDALSIINKDNIAYSIEDLNIYKLTDVSNIKPIIKHFGNNHNFLEQKPMIVVLNNQNDNLLMYTENFGYCVYKKGDNNKNNN